MQRFDRREKILTVADLARDTGASPSAVVAALAKYRPGYHETFRARALLLGRRND